MSCKVAPMVDVKGVLFLNQFNDHRICLSLPPSDYTEVTGLSHHETHKALSAIVSSRFTSLDRKVWGVKRNDHSEGLTSSFGVQSYVHLFAWISKYKCIFCPQKKMCQIYKKGTPWCFWNKRGNAFYLFEARRCTQAEHFENTFQSSARRPRCLGSMLDHLFHIYTWC